MDINLVDASFSSLDETLLLLEQEEYTQLLRQGSLPRQPGVTLQALDLGMVYFLGASEFAWGRDPIREVDRFLGLARLVTAGQGYPPELTLADRAPLRELLVRGKYAAGPFAPLLRPDQFQEEIPYLLEAGPAQRANYFGLVSGRPEDACYAWIHDGLCLAWLEVEAGALAAVRLFPWQISTA